MEMRNCEPHKQHRLVSRFLKWWPVIRWSLNQSRFSSVAIFHVVVTNHNQSNIPDVLTFWARTGEKHWMYPLSYARQNMFNDLLLVNAWSSADWKSGFVFSLALVLSLVSPGLPPDNSPRKTRWAHLNMVVKMAIPNLLTLMPRYVRPMLT